MRHKHSQRKRLVHSEVGELDVYCTTLFDADQTQALLVFTAATAETAQQLRLLAVIGSDTSSVGSRP